MRLPSRSGLARRGPRGARSSQGSAARFQLRLAGLVCSSYQKAWLWLFRSQALSGTGVPGTIDIEALCQAKGLRITEQRRVIARVLSDATDHPDVEELHRRASAIDKGISIATVYRTVRLFEDAGILERHDFRDGRARYEPTPDEHHDHLIDIESGEVIEFSDPRIEALQAEIAERLGYRLVDHRLELYGVRQKGQD